jgi:tRNA threonylcarbamoyladenosine biosynthesis protein TsaB
MALLDSVDVRLEAIDVFAVATGPGSFTGLRVGIATMQGLAFAMGKPLVGVSALDALASIADDRLKADTTTESYVATWIDAWRGEVYAALYEHGREIESPTVEHPAAILGRLSQPHDNRLRSRSELRRVSPEPEAKAEGAARRVLFVGDGAGTFTELIRDTLGDRAVIAGPVAPLLAGAIARLATEVIRAGAYPSPDAIRPLYVRRTDAELARDARAAQ